MLRRTRAPAPSDCSMARKACRIARGTDMLEGVLEVKKEGGVKGRLFKRPGELEVVGGEVWSAAVAKKRLRRGVD